jgi:ornithine--oxo-acid transaminase
MSADVGPIQDLIGELEQHVAPNYHPLPVVLARGEGVWVTDVDGRSYLDALAGYSALNFGHRHPALIEAAIAQLQRVTLTSRAFHHDQLGPFCQELAQLTGLETVLPMNTGAEGVETAIKLSRRWGYRTRAIPADQATIVVATDNFHGRTTTIVGFSNDADARDGFGPFTPGFRPVPFGDAAALEAAIDDTTASVLIEPIQGEAGVIIPPQGYLSDVRRITRDKGVLFIADEVQSGLGRCGATFACELESVRPDAMILGKALGGGVVPVSAVVADREIMNAFTPGSHGSTFGGNPLAAAIGRAVIALLRTGEFQARSRELGERLATGLNGIRSDLIHEVRTVGLWAGVELTPEVPARRVCERLLDLGVLAKDAHQTTVRLSPPLVITEAEVDLLVERLGEALDSV